MLLENGLMFGKLGNVCWKVDNGTIFPNEEKKHEISLLVLHIQKFLWGHRCKWACFEFAYHKCEQGQKEGQWLYRLTALSLTKEKYDDALIKKSGL